MIRQDWEPVVFTKKQNKKPVQINNPAGTKKLNELLEDDIPKNEYYTHEQSLAMIQGRSANKLTQEQLAQKCNLNVSVIRDIENKKSIYNKNLYSRIMRTMNIKI